MKRTAEIVLTIIGVVFYFLSAAFFGLMLALFNNDQILYEVELELTQEEMEAFYAFLDFLNVGGAILIGTMVLGMILGIVAAVLLKGNKNATAAGIILLITSILGSIVTFGAAILPGIFLLIAGIMALVRKAPKPVDDNFNNA